MKDKTYYVLSITEDSFSMSGTSKTRIKGVTEDEATAKAWAAKTNGWCRYDYQEVGNYEDNTTS